MKNLLIETANFESRIKSKHELIVVCVFQNEIFENKYLKKFDPKFKKPIKFFLTTFKNEFGNIKEFFFIHDNDIQKFLFVGLGDKKKFDNEKARIVGSKIFLSCKDLKVTSFTIFPFFELISEENQDNNIQLDRESEEKIVTYVSEGILLSLYSFDKYKTEKKNYIQNKNKKIIPSSLHKENKIDKILLLTSSDVNFRDTLEKTHEIVDAVNYTRDISNLPPNECTPETLAEFAKELSNQYQNLKCKIIEKNLMQTMNLNGILSVGKGSINPPKLIVLEYTGRTNISISKNKRGKISDSKESSRPYLLVGKAVTFDTGGISLKPGDKMDEMKFDKCGGCNILGIIKAIAAIKLPINVIGLIPAVENVPSDRSYKPGDIITMYNSTTVEVLNTDAEGRIILGDALSYGAINYNPQVIIDMATLTGACIIALGSNIGGMMGNNEDLLQKLKIISKETNEQIWELPLLEEFKDQIKSKIADIKNIGGRAGGTITAAAFLSNFVEGFPWVHFDIAGPAWIQESTVAKSYNPVGATGFGVRTLVKYLMQEANS